MQASNIHVFDPELGERTLLAPAQIIQGAINLSGVPVVTGAAQNPASTGADVVIAAFTIPAGALAGPGDSLKFSASGSFAANTNSKTVKIIFNPASATVGQTVGSGGSTIANSGASTASGSSWSFVSQVWKYGAAGSNTQFALNLYQMIGSTPVALLAPISGIVAVESGPILVAVTGNAATTATDIALWAAEMLPVS